MNSNPGAVLRAHQISKSFGDVRALDQVSLEIPAGQSVSVMGPSGSGKSTLMHCLAGILAPDQGDVSLGDEPVSLASDAARSRLRLARMGFVFQDGQLLPELSAVENVALPLLLLGRRVPRRWSSSRQLAGSASVAWRSAGPAALRGQAHRVAIAGHWSDARASFSPMSRPVPRPGPASR